MRNIPQENSLDSTLALLSYGYQFISKKCEHLGSDIFETRIALQKVICMQGESATRIFYDQEKFEHKNVTPGFVMKTLFGQQGLQALDQGHHRRRKELSISLMSPESLEKLIMIIDKQLEASLARWEKAESVQLFDQLNEVLFRSVCQWGGLVFSEEEVDKKTRDVVSMIEGPGTLGVRYWRGRMGAKVQVARKRKSRTLFLSLLMIRGWVIWPVQEIPISRPPTSTSFITSPCASPITMFLPPVHLVVLRL